MARIIIVDDFADTISLIKAYFIGSKHQFYSANNGKAAIKIINEKNPDLILLDVMMPGMSGFQVAQSLKEKEETKSIPVLMITGLEDNKSRAKCFEMGLEYLTKPFNFYDLRMRVNTLLQLTSYKNQLKSAEELIFKLALIAEAKDSYEKGNRQKLASYSTDFAYELGLTDKNVKDIAKGAILHSVGKIEIDDRILSKPGPLTDDEFETIKTYPVAGENICRPLESLKDVLPIIRNHKEKYDGSGYPDKLSGDKIPVLARLVSIADSFNALTTDRPYRKALTKEDAFLTMDQEVEHEKLDPKIYKEFKHIFSNKEISKIKPITIENLI